MTEILDAIGLLATITVLWILFSGLDGCARDIGRAVKAFREAVSRDPD